MNPVDLSPSGGKGSGDEAIHCFHVDSAERVSRCRLGIESFHEHLLIAVMYFALKRGSR